MRFGSPLASGYGSPDNMVKYLRYDRSRLSTTGRIYLLFMMRAGWGGDDVYAGVYIGNTLVANVQALEGVEISVPLPILPFTTKARVQILRIGHYGDPGYSIARVARISEVDESPLVTAQWKWKAKAIGADNDGGFTSNWILNGCTRENTSGVLGQRVWGQLQVDIDVTGGIATVTLTNAGTVVASGAAPVVGAPFTVTLLEQDGSGVSGSVQLLNTVVSTAAAVIYLKWPRAMNILRGVVNPPTVVVATVLYNNRDDANWTEPVALAAGTYYYELQSVSDDNVAGGATAAFAEIVNGPPQAPANLAYVSGSAGAGIRLGFTASPTAGSTYAAYVGTPDTQMDMGAPAATAVAGSTHIDIPAGKLTGSPGVFEFIVRAVHAGFEEKNIDTLLLTLDNTGAVQPLLPNKPAIVLNSISLVGRQISVRVTYPTTDEAGVATQIQLYARNPLGAYALVQTANLVATSTGIKSTTLLYTFPSDQLVFLMAKAITAGGAQGPQSDEVGPYNPSTAADQPAPDDFKFSVARS